MLLVSNENLTDAQFFRNNREGQEEQEGEEEEEGQEEEEGEEEGEEEVRYRI